MKTKTFKQTADIWARSKNPYTTLLGVRKYERLWVYNGEEKTQDCSPHNWTNIQMPEFEDDTATAQWKSTIQVEQLTPVTMFHYCLFGTRNRTVKESSGPDAWKKNWNSKLSPTLGPCTLSKRFCAKRGAMHKWKRSHETVVQYT